MESTKRKYRKDYHVLLPLEYEKILNKQKEKERRAIKSIVTVAIDRYLSYYEAETVKSHAANLL